VLPEDDTLWDIQEQGQERLAHAGLRQYEISAYSLPQQQAKHNINYWRFGDYLGIGAGAHGKITSTGPQGLTILRTRKTRLPKDYLNSEKRFLAGQDRILPEDTALECMMNALRLQEGIPVSDFEARTGMTLDSIRAPLNKALSLGLIECSTDIRASERGQQYLNELLALFLTD